MSTRIWHQSMTDLGRLPGYRAMLGEHAARIGGDDFTVELHGVDPRTYGPGVPPVALAGYALAHHLIFCQFVQNARRAEAEGFDAVAVSCFVDPALELSRAAVDIPVVSSTETALMTAATMGRSFGLITIDRGMVGLLARLVHDYGQAGRVKAIETLDPPMDEFALDAAFHGRGPLVERFTLQARRLIERDGVDVLIPAEGVLNTMLVRNGVRAVDGVPVLDSYGALLQQADMLVRLRRRAGWQVSRQGAYARLPAEAADGLNRLTADVLGLDIAHSAKGSDR